MNEGVLSGRIYSTEGKGRVRDKFDCDRLNPELGTGIRVYLKFCVEFFGFFIFWVFNSRTHTCIEILGTRKFGFRFG